MDISSLFSPVTAALSPTQQAVSQQPKPDTQPQNDLKSGWDNFFAQPSTQGALLSFGLNALAGGWGSPTQNIASALGQGVESGANIAETERKTAEEQEDRQSKRQNQAFEQDYKNRALAQRGEIADKALNSRESIAALRRGPSTLQEQKLYLSAKEKARTAIGNNLKAGNLTATPEEIDAQASVFAQNALDEARRAAGIAGPTFAPQGQAAGPAGGSAGGSVSPPAANVGASSTRGNPAPDGTTVKLPDGTIQKKVNGAWVKQ